MVSLDGSRQQSMKLGSYESCCWRLACLALTGVEAWKLMAFSRCLDKLQEGSVTLRGARLGP